MDIKRAFDIIQLTGISERNLIRFLKFQCTVQIFLFLHPHRADLRKLLSGFKKIIEENYEIYLFLKFDLEKMDYNTAWSDFTDTGGTNLYNRDDKKKKKKEVILITFNILGQSHVLILEHKYLPHLIFDFFVFYLILAPAGGSNPAGN